MLIDTQTAAHITLKNLNALLRKVKSESTDNEMFLSGLINVFRLANEHGYTIFIGHLELGALMANCEGFESFFQNLNWIERIIPYIHIAQYGCKFKPANKGQDRYTSMRLRQPKSLRVESHFPMMHEGKEIKMNEYLRQLAKEGVFAFGADKQVRYVIDREFNITNIITNQQINRKDGTFMVMISIKTERVQGKSDTPYRTNGGLNGFSLEYDAMNIKSVMALYFAMLFNGIPFLNEIYGKNVDIHTLLLNCLSSGLLRSTLYEKAADWGIVESIRSNYKRYDAWDDQSFVRGGFFGR